MFVLGRSRGLSPALGWGWEFSLVSEDGGFGRKSQLATYTDLVSWCLRWLLCGRNQLEYQKSNVWRKNVKLPPAPVPDSWRCTQVLLSNVEKPHSGGADKKVVVKKLCLYDDIAPVGENGEGQGSECRGPRPHVCVGDEHIYHAQPYPVTLQALFRARCAVHIQHPVSTRPGRRI